MNKKKRKFFKDLFSSIVDFDKYKEYILDNLGVSIRYFLKLILLFVLVISIVISFKFSTTLKGLISSLNENIPEVSYKNNILTVGEETNQDNKPIIIEDEKINCMVLIDTTVKEQSKIDEYLEKIKLYNIGILVLRDKAIIKNNTTTTLTSLQYADLAQQYNIKDFNKQDILTLLANTNYIYLYIAIFISVFIYLFTIYLTVSFIDAIVLTVLGYLISRFSRMKIRFSIIFNISAHALTLSIVLNLIYIVINTLTGFNIKYFNWMYTSISYIYMITAILIIKSDLIKRQIQLTRIVEEQEKIRQEQEDLETQDKQEDEKEENGKNEKPEDSNTGEEPESSNA